MSSVIKLQAPFERLKLANESPEVALCRAIILQAIVDVSGADEGLEEPTACASEAASWLFTDSKHLEEICTSAELEVGFVRDVAVKMILFNRNKKAVR